MAEPVLIVGTYISPYVRKVLACLHLKQIPYRIDPLIPFFGNEEFTRMSPLRRVPVLVDGDLVLPDSSVICEYLEDRFPEPRLYPADAAQRARARWLEEYADSRLGDVLIWRLFNQRVIDRFVWGQAPDETMLREATDREIPQILDFLEQTVPASGLLFGDIGVADIAVAVFFRNASFARYEVDSARWPITATFLDRVLGHPALEALRRYEEIVVTTPIAQHREALRVAGAPIAEKTYATGHPRRGLFRV